MTQKRQMKDSGIKWIGQIPQTWGIDRIKSMIKEHFGGCWGSDSNEEYIDKCRLCVRIADFDFNKQVINKKAETYRLYTRQQILTNKLEDGDILVEKSGGGDKTPVGRTVLFNKKDFSQNEVLFANFCECFRPQNISSRFFAYFLKSFYCTNDMHMFFNQTTGIQNLDIQAVINQNMCLPPLQEQQKIAGFLDKECGKIDETSAEIEKQIETLEELKSSIISEAVTKGLNKSAQMKDSGIKWIGNIPHDWKIEKIKFHLKRDEKRNPGNQQVLSVYRDYGVIPKDSRDDNHNATSEDVSKYKYVKPGQLVINKMKAWQGSMGISEYEGIVSPAYFIYDFKNNLFERKYIHYLLRCCYKDEFRRISGGIREGQWDLSPEGFENTLILIPSKKEQEEIVEFIDKKCAEIDSIIEEKNKQLEVLEKYKKSLIYEYVTGKKEVV